MTKKVIPGQDMHQRFESSMVVVDSRLSKVADEGWLKQISHQSILFIQV